MSLLPAYDPENPQSPAFRPDDAFALTGPVGPEAVNDRADVLRAQYLLNTAGYLDLPPGGPTGWPGAGLVQAIRAYQNDNGLTPDGLLLPEGWNDDPRNGETLRSLKDKHGAALAGRPVPDPAAIDARHAALANGAMLSDVQPDTVPFQPGRQVAQAWRFVVQPVAPPAALLPDGGDTGESDAPAHPPYISDANARIAAGVTRGLRNAGNNLGRIVDGIDTIKRLAPYSPWLVQDISRSLLADPSPATPPSQAVNDNDRAATQTPPLVPPRQDDAPAPRPGDSAPDLPDEKLIPPQIRDWYEGLEPFDQKLARELMLVYANPHGARGKQSTQQGNNLIVQEIFRQLKEDFPHLRKWVTHTHGATLEGGNAKNGRLKEEYIPAFENGVRRRRGSTRPDISVLFARYMAQYLRFNSASRGRDGNWTDDELDQRQRVLANTRGEDVVLLDKMADGETKASYLAKIRAPIRDRLQKLDDDVQRSGEFDRSNPEDPVKYKYHWENEP